jgi:hypothetical protein
LLEERRRGENIGDLLPKKKSGRGGFIYKKESQFPEIDIGDMIRDLVRWYHSYIRLVGNRVLSMDRRILERKLTRRVEWSGVECGDWGVKSWGNHVGSHVCLSGLWTSWIRAGFRLKEQPILAQTLARV